MPRTREFCPDDALDKAMHVFWAKGYFGTSIEDLVSATGVSRYGLYGEFGDKHGLFLAALERYQSHVIKPILDIVQQPDASLTALRSLFETIASAGRDSNERLGCLMFNAVSELGQHGDLVSTRVGEFRERVAAGLRQMLRNAVAKGELPPGFDVEREADFLFGILHALPVMARSGIATSAIDNVVGVALDTLR